MKKLESLLLTYVEEVHVPELAEPSVDHAQASYILKHIREILMSFLRKNLRKPFFVFLLIVYGM